MPVRKVLVLYWATYCGYCKELLPTFQEIFDKQKKYKFEVQMIEKDDMNPILYQQLRYDGTLKTYPTIVMEKYTKNGIIRKKMPANSAKERTKAKILAFAKKRF